MRHTPASPDTAGSPPSSGDPCGVARRKRIDAPPATSRSLRARPTKQAETEPDRKERCRFESGTEPASTPGHRRPAHRPPSQRERGRAGLTASRAPSHCGPSTSKIRVGGPLARRRHSPPVSGSSPTSPRGMGVHTRGDQSLTVHQAGASHSWGVGRRTARRPSPRRLRRCPRSASACRGGAGCASLAERGPRRDGAVRIESRRGDRARRPEALDQHLGDLEGRPAGQAIPCSAAGGQGSRAFAPGGRDRATVDVR